MGFGVGFVQLPACPGLCAGGSAGRLGQRGGDVVCAASNKKGKRARNQGGGRARRADKAEGSAEVPTRSRDTEGSAAGTVHASEDAGSDGQSTDAGRAKTKAGSSKRRELSLAEQDADLIKLMREDYATRLSEELKQPTLRSKQKKKGEYEESPSMMWVKRGAWTGIFLLVATFFITHLVVVRDWLPSS
ncbi:hypothetical protein FVE85_5935 [Porphyridium purpureum]|uniref:Transmembrane protein n=1 Tax=Porphyridium purpureum TaxID=35688 RepID=A0A5J4Z544_PORPP|nr:hypothetical protein FVE85_5935 [Porphyridium purpureum]|eukprot:POR8179..scf295_1